MPNNGGAAFPRPLVRGVDGNLTDWGAEGMSLRHWFAGTYAAGLARYHHMNPDAEEIATISYKVADALIEQGNK